MLKTTAVILAVCIAAAAVGGGVVLYTMAGNGAPADAPDDEFSNEYLGMRAKYDVSDATLISVVSGTIEIKVVDEKKVHGKIYVKTECTYNIKVGSDRYQGVVVSDFVEIEGGGTVTSVFFGVADSKVIGTEKNMRVNVNGKSYRIDTTKYSAEFREQPAVIWVGDKDDMVYKVEATPSGVGIPPSLGALLGIKLICTLSSTNMI